MSDNIAELETALATSQTEPQRIDALNALAWALLMRDSERALTLSREALERSQTGAYAAEPYLKGKAAAMINIARAELFLFARVGSSIAQFEAALDICRQIGDRKQERFALMFISAAFGSLGQHERALEYALNQLQVAEELGEAHSYASAINAVGFTYLRMGNVAQAQAHYERAYDAYRLVDDPHERDAGLAAVCNNLCGVHLEQNNPASAHPHALEALRLFERLDNRNGQVSTLASLGDIALRTGDTDAALAHYTRALAITREQGWALTKCLTDLAGYYLHIGEAQHALDQVNTALADPAISDNKRDLVRCYEFKSRAHESLGDYEAALAAYKQYDQIKAELSDEEQKRRIENLDAHYQTESARKEAEFYRLRSAELEAQREQDLHYFDSLSELKDEAINTVSHDLKSPLSSVNLNLFAIRRLTGDNPQVAAYLDRIAHNVARMTDLISDLLDLARLETGRGLERRPVVLSPILIAALDDHAMQAQAKSLTLDATSLAADIVVEIDPAQIRQVVDNLLSNAIKFTPPGGHITLSAVRSGEEIRVQLSDTGIGIPEADLPHIFDRFFRVRSPEHEQVEGTGLGLSLARKIVEEHGGRIWAESIPGSGTTFRFSLPVPAVVEPAR